MQVTDAMVAKAADIFCENGIHIAVPQDGDLDDLERERYETLRAALTAALAEMWRPADEAPIWSGEGVPPYVIVTNGHHSGVGYRMTPLYLDDPEFVDEHAEFIEPRVTHFMPLPAPPRGK